MTEMTEQGWTQISRFQQREQALTYVETHFRTSELARFLAWIREGPDNRFTWGGKRWERWLTPKQGLLMALCPELGRKRASTESRDWNDLGEVGARWA